MPEGDTVWLAASRLNSALSGRVLTRAELRVPALGAVSLVGDTILEVAPLGKHMLMRLGSGQTLHSHLRMDGRWVISKPGTRRGGLDHEIRVLLDNGTWQATGFRIHDLALIPTTREHDIVGHLGPDILSPSWATGGADEAERRVREQPERAIGESLLDQRCVAGIGNLYKMETLFMARTNPWVPSGAADVHGLLALAHRLMTLNLNHPEQSTTGILRRGQEHWVYGRGGDACRRCGTPILVGRQGPADQDRITFWCPSCQAVPAGAV
jgi:endonuclease-8